MSSEKKKTFKIPPRKNGVLHTLKITSNGACPFDRVPGIKFKAVNNRPVALSLSSYPLVYVIVSVRIEIFKVDDLC